MDRGLGGGYERRREELLVAMVTQRSLLASRDSCCSARWISNRLEPRCVRGVGVTRRARVLFPATRALMVFPTTKVSGGHLVFQRHFSGLLYF